MCRKKGLKLNADKRKVMVLDGEEGLICEITVHRTPLEGFSWLNNWGVFWISGRVRYIRYRML